MPEMPKRLLNLALTNAPWLVGLGLLTSLFVLVKAWRGSAGTALRPAVAWGFIAIGLALVGEVIALGESAVGGRPQSDRWIYLSLLATLAALLTVLNARSPGGGAWAILMTMLVVVFLLPWLEGAGLARQRGGWDRLRLASPWSYFLGILVFAAITNYVTTRYSLASLAALGGFAMGGVALTRTDMSPDVRGAFWAAVPLFWSATLLLAYRASRRRRDPMAPPLTVLWLWFRDHWGTVWALRTRDRFNRTAELAKWPIRLDWTGAVGVSGESPPQVPDEALATLVNLLRRFATPARMDEVVARGRGADLADSPQSGDHVGAGARGLLDRAGPGKSA